MAKISVPFTFLISIILAITVSLPPSNSQPQQPPNITGICNGIQISYIYNSGRQIPPTFLPSDPNSQPYRFQSTLVVQNNGQEELNNWKVFVGFQHREFLASASNAVLVDGTSLPADVSNGTTFSGSPVTDLKTAIETAGDLNKIQARVELEGTEFGVGAPDVPLPSNITLVNDGYSCSSFNTSQGKNVTSVCCVKDLNATSNTTDDDFEPLQDGDLTIMYDVLRVYDTYYWAQVTITNYNNNSRLDNWQLSWEWMRNEFIYSMRGAYPAVVDTSDCIFGSQGKYYTDLDFSTALNCERRPTIIDLPPDRKNDNNLGMIPFCCRNGTILPPATDASQSMSVFNMQVYKMDPDLNRTEFNPPQNWMIKGTSNNYGYQCAQPVQVSPSLFPNPSGLSSEVAAVASWQVVCNITRTPQQKPKCCVSFSSFLNDSAVPCNTCACGCNLNPSTMCNASASALLVPPEALLVPFDNRTKKALSLAKEKRQVVPKLLPCADNCGVNINWHLLSDYRDGWTARITLFNWDKTDIIDWFAAMELDKAAAGFEAVYSINGSILPNSSDILLLYGFPGSNYLIAEKDPSNPKKGFPLPGTQQSVISFTKKNTPGIKVARGDGFPSKVYFNGEECSLPAILPISFGWYMAATSTSSSILFAMLVLMLLWL